MKKVLSFFVLTALLLSLAVVPVSAADDDTPEGVAVIMGKEKANQKEKLKIPMERVRRFFPASYTTVQMEEEIVKMCETRYRSRVSRER